MAGSDEAAEMGTVCPCQTDPHPFEQNTHLDNSKTTILIIIKKEAPNHFSASKRVKLFNVPSGAACRLCDGVILKHKNGGY